MSAELISLLAQIPLVAAVIWFVLKRDGTWMGFVEKRDGTWMGFVAKRDEAADKRDEEMKQYLDRRDEEMKQYLAERDREAREFQARQYEQVTGVVGRNTQALRRVEQALGRYDVVRETAKRRAVEVAGE